MYCRNRIMSYSCDRSRVPAIGCDCMWTEYIHRTEGFHQARPCWITTCSATFVLLLNRNTVLYAWVISAVAQSPANQALRFCLVCFIFVGEFHALLPVTQHDKLYERLTLITAPYTGESVRNYKRILESRVWGAILPIYCFVYHHI